MRAVLQGREPRRSGTGFASPGNGRFEPRSRGIGAALPAIAHPPGSGPLVSLRALPRLLCLCCALGASAVPAGETQTRAVPPLPESFRGSLVLPRPVRFDAEGRVSWIQVDYEGGAKVASEGCGDTPVSLFTWSPATGVISSTPLGVGAAGINAQVATAAGIFFLPFDPQVGSRCVALLRPGGGVATARMTQPFAEPQLVALSSESIAVIEPHQDSRHLRVELVQWRAQGGLQAMQMPMLAVPFRRNFQAAALPDGRLMILGGSNDEFRGCQSCRAETHVLDPRAGRWSAGPAMLQPRSEHLATRLPDGSILVTGGWTPEQAWNSGPSRSAERWNPATNAFEAVAPMPSATARHRAVWWPGQESSVLLVGGGMSGSLHAYHVKSGEWRAAGSFVQGNEDGRCALFPLLLAGNAYAWRDGCAGGQNWGLSALRPAAPAASSPPEALLVDFRAGAARLPAEGDRPALSIGGAVHAGMNRYLPSSAVEAIDASGAVRALPVLNKARSGATAIRVGAGVLVVGGLGEETETKRAPFSRPLESVEWLASDAPGSAARWIELPAMKLPPVLASAPGGSFLGFNDSANIQRFTLRPGSGGVPAVPERELPYPHMNGSRQGSDGQGNVALRVLADGRVVVAGGTEHAHRIAVHLNDVEDPEAGDVYTSVGPQVPSRRHEIFDPASGEWRYSAPSRSAGGRVAVLPDGRVVRIGRLPSGKGGDAGGAYLVEVSNARGTAWSPRVAPKMKLGESTRPFVAEGELFLSGQLGTLQALEWFNAAANRWEVLWWADPYDHWSNHLGRVIVRQLANGKRVVLPVEGY